MKIVLVEDVSNLGQKGQEIQVKDGYARNFLFPRKLAVLSASKEGKEMLIKTEKEAEKPHKKTIAQQISDNKNILLVFKAKASPKGKLYRAISTKDIAKKLDIESKEIVKIAKITTVGEHEIEIKFKDGSIIKIKIIINKADK